MIFPLNLLTSTDTVYWRGGNVLSQYNDAIDNVLASTSDEFLMRP